MPPVIASVPAQRQTQYNVERRFLRGSKLHIYLAVKEPDMIQANKTEYTLFVVLSALRHVISRERLYDPNNTTVIICSVDLERALDMKFLHVTEIRDVVLTQMELLPPVLLASLPNTPVSATTPQPVSQNFSNNSDNSRNLETASSVNLANTQTPNIPGNGQQQISAGNSAKFDIEGRYWVKPLFLKVLRQVRGVNPTQVVFSYREVTSYLSQYILDNKDKFFDNRNIKIAHVEGDPLGIAFNVKVFHRTQVTTLLRNQLIPFGNNININTKVFKPSPDNSQTLVVNRAEIQSSQALTTSLQEINSASRKRSAADELNKDEDLKRDRRQNSSPSVKKERESDEETIYSAQGYSTTTMDNADEDIEASDDSDAEDPDRSSEVNEYDVYEIEYEPEGATSDEEQFESNSSKKAGNNKAKKVCNSSGESDIDDIVIAIAVKKLNEVDEYSEETSDEGDEAESSNDEADDFTMADPENQDYWKCLSCKQPNTPYIRYCSACYKERKGWLPDRPKPKKKRVEKSKNDVHSSKNISSKGQKSTKGQPVKSSLSARPIYERSLSELTTSSQESQETEPSSSQDSGFSEEKVPEINSSDEDDQKTEKNLVKRAQDEKMNNFIANPNMLCTLCCAAPKNACLVHGRISHQVCCYGCAKKLFKNHRGCPVCRRKIEKITKNIIA